MRLLGLPHELLLSIMSHFELASRGRMARTCRLLRILCDSPCVWRVIAMVAPAESMPGASLRKRLKHTCELYVKNPSGRSFLHNGRFCKARLPPSLPGHASLACGSLHDAGAEALVKVGCRSRLPVRTPSRAHPSQPTLTPRTLAAPPLRVMLLVLSSLVPRPPRSTCCTYTRRAGYNVSQSPGPIRDGPHHCTRARRGPDAASRPGTAAPPQVAAHAHAPLHRMRATSLGPPLPPGHHD